MASYDLNNDDDKVQRLNELTVMGRRRESLVYTLYVRDGNEEKRSQKALIDPGFTFLLDSKDLKVMSTNQERKRDG
jgi:hypothetical protein